LNPTRLGILKYDGVSRPERLGNNFAFWVII